MRSIKERSSGIDTREERVIERRWEKFRGLSRVCRQISRAAYYQNGELTRFPTSAYAG